MKILVTGAGGLIGGYLARTLSRQGHQVVATYRNSEPTQSSNNIEIKWVKLDLADGLQQLEPVDVIIHAAAHTHLVLDSTASDYIQSNLVGTVNLAKYAQATGTRLVVYISTLSVYGAIEVAELREDTPLNGPQMYGATKYMSELILKEHAGDFPSVCIRLPGVVGEGYFTPWLGSVVEKAFNDEPVNYYNPDSLFNNIIDLRELSEFITHLLNAQLTGFEVVNLASSEPIRIQDVVEQIMALTGSNSTLLAQVSERPSFSISIEKVIREFEFQPATTSAIVERYVNENKAAMAANSEG